MVALTAARRFSAQIQSRRNGEASHLRSGQGQWKIPKLRHLLEESCRSNLISKALKLSIRSNELAEENGAQRALATVRR
jgi:hypothetical protein